MLLRDMLAGIDFKVVYGSLDKDITGLTNDSRKVSNGTLFVCIHGTNIDSHDFILQVAAAGAAAVVIEEDIPEKTLAVIRDGGVTDGTISGNAAEERCKSREPQDGLTVVRVDSSRLAIALLADAWFGHPSRSMKVIGITGTKGKTTTTYMLKAIFEEAGHKVGLIGTNGTVIGDHMYHTSNTTPDSYVMQEYFRKMADEGCEYVVMEVSSQGLMMHRVDGVDFDLGMFTNISPDHISPNEHKNFEEYRSCKGLLFRKCRTGIVNTDDPNCGALVEGHTCRLLSMGMSGGEDYTASEVRHVKRGSFMGVRFLYEEKGGESFEVETDIPGLFSVYNSLAAVSAARFFGIAPEAINAALGKVHVNGRMEIVYASDKLTVIVDYAHNGVATRSLLAAIRDYKPKRLVVVFGCGGNRAAQRRIEMGEAAGSMADFSIITEDNSRYEKVEDIIKDIHSGFDKTGGKSIDITDRHEAIRYSILNSEDGDVVAIIGKGHEDYQEVNGVRRHFLDREEAEAALHEAGFM